MDDFLGKLKSGANKVAFEAEKLGKQAEAKADMESLRFSLQSKYAELGRLYYSQRASGGAADPAAAAAATPATAAKFCSSCGKEMAREAKFCPNCGASN